MPEFSFRRSFPWLQKALAPQIPISGPDFVLSTLVPTLDIFGTSRLEDTQFDDVLGQLGVQEATHTRVPADRVRHYLAMQYSHDDVSLREIAPVIIVQTPTGFPGVALRDARQTATNTLSAVTNVVVPPRGFIGARVGGGIAPGARITLRVIWVEMTVGEYVRGLPGIGGS